MFLFLTGTLPLTIVDCVFKLKIMRRCLPKALNKLRIKTQFHNNTTRFNWTTCFAPMNTVKQMANEDVWNYVTCLVSIFAWDQWKPCYIESSYTNKSKKKHLFKTGRQLRNIWWQMYCMTFKMFAIYWLLNKDNATQSVNFIYYI